MSHFNKIIHDAVHSTYNWVTGTVTAAALYVSFAWDVNKFLSFIISILSITLLIVKLVKEFKGKPKDGTTTKEN